MLEKLLKQRRTVDKPATLPRKRRKFTFESLEERDFMAGQKKIRKGSLL